MRGHAEAAPAETTPPGTRAPRVTLAPWRQWAREGLAAAFARRDARVLACQAVFALLALAALLRLALILRGWPSLDSDEAVVGLMARHILHNGEYPDFFWGQFYLGPLQAYAAAALFAVFGASLVALRLPALLFTLGALAGVYALGRAAYGRAVGLLALAWLALGPPYALIRQIVADGGHQEMLLLAALLLLGVWDRLRRPMPDAVPPRAAGFRRAPLRSFFTRVEAPSPPLRPLRPPRFLSSALPLRVLRGPPRPPRSPNPPLLRGLRARFASFALSVSPMAPPRPAGRGGRGVRTLLEYFGIGAAMGLGFWSDPLMLPVLIAALGALLLGRRRELFSLAGLALVLGFCVGAFPFLLFNVTSGGASFAQIAHQRQLPGGEGASFSLAALPGQVGETLSVALPVTFGSPHVCVTQGNIWGWYPPRLAANVAGTGLCQDANILFSLGILALYAAAALPIVRRFRVAGNAEAAKMREGRGEGAEGFTTEETEGTEESAEAERGTAEGAEGTEGTEGLRGQGVGARHASPASREGQTASESAPMRFAARGGPADESAPMGVPPQSPPARAGDREARGDRPRSSRPSRSLRVLRVHRLFSSQLTGGEDSAALWLRGMLLFIALFTIAAYASGTDAQLNQFTAARYFISLWLTTPLLFGVLWGWAQPAVRAASAWIGRMIARRGGGRTPYAPTGPTHASVPSVPSSSPSASSVVSPASASLSASSASSAVSPSPSALSSSVSSVPSVVNSSPPSRSPRTSASSAFSVTPSRIAAALVLLVVFALALFEAGYTLAYSGDAARFGLPMTRTDQQLTGFLDAHHITRYYSDYWTCYRIAFESDERIVCAVRGQNGEPQLRLMNNRYPGYERLLAATPYPAYILPAGSPADANFASEAAAQGLPHAGYVRAEVAGYAVYYHPA